MSDEKISDEQWQQQAQQALRQSEQDIDTAHLHPLRSARRNAVALAQEQAKQAPRQWSWWLPAGGVGAMAAALVLALTLSSSSLDPLPLMPDAEMAAAADAEMLEELEFAAWILVMEQADERPNQG